MKAVRTIGQSRPIAIRAGVSTGSEVAVLARALRNDYRATDLRVTLVGDDQSPAEIASAARVRGSRTPPMDSYVDLEPALGAADWRCELLSLVEPT